jgi:hypothetical protein
MFLYVHLKRDLNFPSVETKGKLATLVEICKNLSKFSAMNIFHVFRVFLTAKNIESNAEISKTGKLAKLAILLKNPNGECG